jgi:hypothetical protein
MLKLILRLILCAALPIALGAAGCNRGGGYGGPTSNGFADHN